MTPNTTDLLQVRPNLRRAWLNDEMILMYNVTALNIPLMTAWSQDLFEVLETWRPEGQYCFLFDLSLPAVTMTYLAMTRRDVFNIGITRTGQIEFEKFLTTQAPKQARLGLVLSQTASGKIAHKYNADARKELADGKMFFEIEAAVEWLVSQNRALTRSHTRQVSIDNLKSIARNMTQTPDKRFGDRKQVHLVVNGALETITFQQGHMAIIGRRHASDIEPVDLDLTSYGEVALSVSRQHARLAVIEQQLYIVDLGSTNGTFIDGERLPAYQPIIVKPEQTVTLGRVDMTVVY